LCSIEHSASRHQAAEFVAYKERILGTGTVDRGSDVQHRKLVLWGVCDYIRTVLGGVRTSKKTQTRVAEGWIVRSRESKLRR
jgi:hypothetical protein